MNKSSNKTQILKRADGWCKSVYATYERAWELLNRKFEV